MDERELTPEQRENRRLELAAAAAASERSNRPRIWTVLAAILVVVAAVYTISGFIAWRNAEGGVEALAQQTARIEQRLDELRTQTAALETAGYERDTSLVARLEALAAQIGLEGVRVTGGNFAPGEGVPGVRKREWQTQLRGQDPRLMLDWLARSVGVEGVEGLQIARVRLTPGQTAIAENVRGWNMEVDFVRWEREQ